MSTPARLLVYGSRDFGRLLAVLAGECGREVAGFIDDVHTGPDVLGNWDRCRDTLGSTEFQVVLGVGYRDLPARRALIERVRADGYRLATLIHPRARVSAHALVGEGTVVMAGADVDAFAELGPAVVLWPGALVSHHCRVEGNTFLSPNSTICGFSRVGWDSFVGAGAVVPDRAVVPPGSFVKAGRVFAP